MSLAENNAHNSRGAPIAPHLQPPVLLVPGEYELQYLTHRLTNNFGRGCLTLFFEVCDQGAATLEKHYPVTLTGKHKFTAGRGSDLVKHFRVLFPRSRIKRLDRIPLQWLKGKRCLGRVGTVTKDYEQKPLQDEAQYSVIRELLPCH